ncbi:MAG TPA: DUF6178 family protein, partial [Candidatus Binataceae bacterium]|nr:DUF6178 family protein [Candidatus Binataceae bacterium]
RSEMALVTNQVLVARQIDFGDPDAVRVAVEMTHNYLNLSLEHLAGGDLKRAVEVIRDTYLKLLFRLGVSLTIDLRKRAQAVLGVLGFDSRRTREIPYLDSPFREAIEGFLMTQPRFFAGLDRTGAVTMRDFRAMRDIRLGYALLDEIESVVALMRGLLGIDIASASFRAAVAARDLRLSQILLTAFAREALEGRFAVEPIEASRLNDLHRAIMNKGHRPYHLSDGFRTVVDAVMEERLDDDIHKRGARYVNSCLNILEDEFSELEPAKERIDPRFIRSVLIAR